MTTWLQVAMSIHLLFRLQQCACWWPERCFIDCAARHAPKVLHSVCLLPWHSSLSAHNFQGAFSTTTKLARPLAKVVFYCSVVFWKKRTEQKATNIPKHKKTKQLSVRYSQQRLKLIFTKKTRFRIKLT